MPIVRRNFKTLALAHLTPLHLACAERGDVDVFLTTDDALLSRARHHKGALRISTEPVGTGSDGSRSCAFGSPHQVPAERNSRRESTKSSTAQRVTKYRRICGCASEIEADDDLAHTLRSVHCRRVDRPESRDDLQARRAGSVAAGRQFVARRSLRADSDAADSRIP